MNELTVTEPGSLLIAITAASTNPDVNVDKLERLLAMHEKMQAKQAEQEFALAMNSAQSDMGRISADAVNAQTRSAYASYGQLDKVLRPIYVKHGFSLSFDTDEHGIENVVRVKCYVSHKAGFTRTYRADVPSDGKGAKGNDVMTKTHAFGSGTSYGMRYLLKMIFNVAIGETDDDGNQSDASKETEHLKRLITHNDAARKWIQSIAFIKEGLKQETPDLYALKEAWGELPQDDQMALWVAPTKGGIFTTEERKTIHEGFPDA